MTDHLSVAGGLFASFPAYIRKWCLESAKQRDFSSWLPVLETLAAVGAVGSGGLQAQTFCLWLCLPTQLSDSVAAIPLAPASLQTT